MRLGILLSSLSLAALTAAAAQAAEITVATTAIVEHPALEAARDGIRDELKAAGYEEGRNLRFLHESAQGSPAIAAQIARKFVGQAPDVIVPISTPSAQAVASATKDIPVVFTAVTDPLGARLVGDMKTPGGNVTGTTDLSPIGQHLDLVMEISPDAKTLGVPFNPGEANSVSLVNLIKQEAPARGLTVVEAPATKSSDVLSAAQSLIGKADVIYVPTDSTVVTALQAVVKVGVDNRIPVLAGDTDSVLQGAIAAIGFNYYDVGRQTGKMVLRVLKGEAPGAIAVEGVETTQLYVNPAMAEKMGVTLSESLLAKADEVVR